MNNHCHVELEGLIGYHYQLWAYSVSHSTLIIRGIHPDKPHHNVHLTFADIRYMQLTVNWDGDFKIAPEEAFYEVAKKSFSEEVFEWPLLKEFYWLYQAETIHGQIRILGKLGKIEFDIEPIYH